jgi:alanyl aminopeptidase
MLALLPLLAVAAPPPPLRLPDDVTVTRMALDLRLDPLADGFSGVADVDLDVRGPHRAIALDARELGFADVTVTAGGVTQTARIHRDDADTVEVRVKHPVDGAVHVRLAYTGTVRKVDTTGVFREVERDDAYLFTQFEATDARAAFPCIDEPDAKVPWAITLHVPAGQVAVSNTDPTSTTVGADGWTKLVFAETPPLPSYLVAFAVGPFDVVDAGTAGQNHVPVRMVVPHGRGGGVDYAADTTGPLLERLEAWFGTPYPYAKLDVVAIPQTVGFGAMENAGMITVQADIQLDADRSVSDRRDWALTIAHEMAHQWFGDLVTPRWWDDIWLNESFATWMETKIVGEWHPDWDLDPYRVEDASWVMAEDGLASARAIRQPITSYDDIENGFDGISYSKGSAVLAMFESWRGADRFRDGIRAYLAAHANGNASLDDLLVALGPETAGPMRTFLDQPGVPLITVGLDCAGTPALTLSQAQWLPTGSVAAQPERWQVPICARWGTSDGVTGTDCTLLADATGRLPLTAPACPAWVDGNAGAMGYYRVQYAEPQLAALLGGDAPLTVAERVAAVGDAAALVESGQLAPADVLGAVPGLVAGGDRHVIGATIGVVAALDGDLVPEDLRPKFQAFVRDTYGPLAREVGLVAQDGEPPATTLLRPELIALVGGAGEDPWVAAEARRLTDTWLVDRSGIDADLVDAVLRIAARHGDRALFDALLANARAEPDREKRIALLAALGSFRDPELLRAAFGIVISGEFDLRESAGVFAAPFGDRETRPIAWEFLVDNVDAVAKQIPGIARAYLITAGGAWCDDAHADEVRAVFGKRAKRWIGGPRTLDQTVEKVRICAASTAEQAPGVRAFLER